MAYMSDIEIAQSCQMKNIREIAKTAGVDEKYLELYGNYKAKVDYNLLNEVKGEDGKLILVTAISPTPAGEGKTAIRSAHSSARRAWAAIRSTRWAARSSGRWRCCRKA